jgi:hypothetical protein
MQSGTQFTSGLSVVTQQADIQNETDLHQWARKNLGPLFRANKIVKDLTGLAVRWDAAPGDKKQTSDLIRKLNYCYDDLYIGAQFILQFISLHTRERKYFRTIKSYLDAAMDRIEVEADYALIPVLDGQFKIFFKYLQHSHFQELIIRRFVNLDELARKMDWAFSAGEEASPLAFQTIAEGIVKVLGFLDQTRQSFDFIAAAHEAEKMELQAQEFERCLNRESYIDKLPFFLEYLKEENLRQYAFLNESAIAAKIVEIEALPEEERDDETALVVHEMENAINFCTAVIENAFTDDNDIAKAKINLATLTKLGVSVIDNKYVIAEPEIDDHTIIYFDNKSLVEKLNSVITKRPLKVHIYDLRYKFNLISSTIDWLSRMERFEVDYNLLYQNAVEEEKAVDQTPVVNKIRQHQTLSARRKLPKKKKSGNKFRLITELPGAETSVPATVDLFAEDKARRLRQIALLTEEIADFEKRLQQVFSAEYLTFSDRAKAAKEECEARYATLLQAAYALKIVMEEQQHDDQEVLTNITVRSTQLQDEVAYYADSLQKHRAQAKLAVQKKGRLETLIRTPRRTSENMNERDRKLLNRAGKHLLYINKIMAQTELEDEIKLYALLYNIFCCFEVLQKFKCNDEKETSDMQFFSQINAKIATGLLTLPVITSLVESIQQVTTNINPKGQIWQKELNIAARDLFFPEFKVDSSADIAKTQLYSILAEFNQRKIPAGSVAENMLPEYIMQLRTLLLMYAGNESIKDAELFTDADLSHLQALRMLAVLAAIEDSKENGKKENIFMQFCHDEATQGVSYESRATALHNSVLWFARKLQEKLPALKKLSSNTINTPSPVALRYAPASPTLFSLPRPDHRRLKMELTEFKRLGNRSTE